MNRRQVLAAGGAAAFGAVAGCLGNDRNGSEEFMGVTVTLAPIDDVYEWYQDGEARFVDARGRGQYDYSHIEGAVFSTAPHGLSENDPTEDWDLDTQIVTYCGCPHHLSGQRASSLISEGYEDTYALDEGFEEWRDRDYPMAGTNVAGELPAYDVRGRADPTYEGEYVRVADAIDEQVEIAPIQADGSYEMTLHFVGLSADSVLELEAPDYALEAPLSKLTSDVVTAEL